MPTITIYLPDEMYEFVKDDPSHKIQDSLAITMPKKKEEIAKK